VDFERRINMKKYTGKIEYEVSSKMCGAMNSGVFTDIKTCKNIITALFWFVVFKFKYPVVTLEISGRASKCEYCCHNSSCDMKKFFECETK
jgi:hypothetical protein